MTADLKAAALQAIAALERTAHATEAERLAAAAALRASIEDQAPAEAHSEPREPAPLNDLPSWSECDLIIANHEFRQRAAAGLEGAVLDLPEVTPTPTALHRFIHEYDDADPYRSDWFMHRLELVVKEAQANVQPKGTDAALERMRHIANEWADMATNGTQWLRNIRDGISTVDEALAHMAKNYEHCRKVNDAPGLYGSDDMPAPAPAPVNRGLSTPWGDADDSGEVQP